MTSRLNVLMVAYAFEPGRGSEPEVGWSFARAMARHHTVWVLTYAGNRDAVEAALRRNPVPGLHVVYHELPLERRRYLHGGETRSGLTEQAHGVAWHLSARRVVKDLHRRVGFDVGQHVTWVKYWNPSAVAALPVPYVWGPVGGGERPPESFYADFLPSLRRYEQKRDTAQAVMRRDPWVRQTAQRSALALATTPETASRLIELGAPRVEVRSAIGLWDAECGRLAARQFSSGLPVRFACIGRLVPFKGFQYAIRAFAHACRSTDRWLLQHPELWIIGDGPYRGTLERLAASSGVAHCVRFFGRLPREETLDRLADIDILVHPSLHESGGGVCLEAMAAGCPVLGLALGGVRIHVTSDTGVLVEAETPSAAIDHLAEKMVSLAADPDRRERLGRAGQARVRDHFTWEKKAERMADTYRTVLARSGSRAEGSLYAEAL